MPNLLVFMYICDIPSLANALPICLMSHHVVQHPLYDMASSGACIMQVIPCWCISVMLQINIVPVASFLGHCRILSYAYVYISKHFTWAPKITYEIATTQGTTMTSTWNFQVVVPIRYEDQSRIMFWYASERENRWDTDTSHSDLKISGFNTKRLRIL